jgi:hypothetical protein
MVEISHKLAPHFCNWLRRIEVVNEELMPRFLHARICYEVKRFAKTNLRECTAAAAVAAAVAVGSGG